MASVTLTGVKIRPGCFHRSADPVRFDPKVPDIEKLLCCRACVTPQLTAVRFPILSEPKN
jgi:hypothetical protein